MMGRVKILILILLTILNIYLSKGAIRNAEQKLVEHLLKNYSKQARPVNHPDVTVNATFGIELVQLIKVDDRNQFITTKIWVRQSWNNMLMKWDPKDWENVAHAQIDANLLWVPDIVLYNNADDEFTGGTEKYKTRILVYPDGTAYWMAPATFISTCKIDIKYFPFDRQTCSLKFGSWTFNQKGINILKDHRPLVTSQYVNSSEWDIVGAQKVVTSVLYNCCPVPYVDITFKITLLRKPLYYIFNVITPCLVLVTTILFGFFLPPESGERISLTITILLAVAVFLQLISDALPRNSDNIPILAIFYMVIMAESAFSLVTTCVVLVVHYRSSEKGATPMPNWIRFIFIDTLSKPLGIIRLKPLRHSASKYLHDNRRDTHADIDMKESYVNNQEDIKSWVNEINIYQNHENGNCLNHRDRSVTTVTSDSSDNKVMRGNKPGIENEIDSTLEAILNEVQIITSSIRHQHHHGELQEEWRFLAKVLDRLFFWIFLLTVVLSASCILIPVYYKYN